MKKFTKKGFTLIELLVVIAVIGILSSIVLVSLSGARNKAKDANIQADLAALRAGAELYADTGDYSGFCASGDASKAISAIAKQGKTAVCNDAADSWAACSPIYDTTNLVWCVDSAGNSKAEPTMTCTTAGFTGTVCP